MLISAQYQQNNQNKLVTKKKIEHYTYGLDDVIGEGFSSHVYKGKNDFTGDAVAVKVVQMDKIKTDTYKDLLASEIYCLKQLRGAPHIIQLKDVFTTKNNTYVVCELCEGTLSSLMSRRKLSQNESVRLMEQLIKGYRQFQKIGIIHRDLKPANIFLQGDQIRIADFGFAICTSENKIQEKFNIGSPLYMPPESLTSNQYSFGSDIWSLGIVFYELLCGKAPWNANTEAELLNRIHQSPIANLIPKHLSQQNSQFLLRALDPNVKTRMTPDEMFAFNFSGKPKQPTLRKNVTLIKEEERLVSTNGTNTSTSGEESGGLTKQLLCQVHFCRFIFKLIIRMIDSDIKTREFDGTVIGLKNYLGIKLSEICQLQQANTFNIRNLNQYRKTLDFTKLITLAKTYTAKYQAELGKLVDNPSMGSIPFILQNLPQTIRYLSSRFSKVTKQNLVQHESNIIIMDYLTTLFMLVKLVSRNDLAVFAAKSKMEEIVDGQNISVSYDHFMAIQHKLSLLGLA